MVALSVVSLISKKIIKPSIPTPLSLKSHKLSFVDQVFHTSIPVAFFYPKVGNYSFEPTLVSRLVEKSLSKTLSFYYPYAGRLKNGSSVDCNDKGVELSTVRVRCSMSEIFKHPYTEAEHVVFPQAKPQDHSEENLAIAQVSHFDCGGIAIGACLSHKIGDGCTAGNFLYNWGVLSRDISATPSPRFVGESIYPQDMRQRLNPPLSHDACGNVLSGFFVKTTNERELNCPRLIREMRKEKEKLHDQHKNATKIAIVPEVVDSLEKGRTPFHSSEVDHYVCTSVLQFPFYETDFGWGRPARVSMATGPFNNFFFLMDNQSGGGGGVEAIVMLGEQDMAIFERDPELLEFAIPIPNH